MDAWEAPVRVSTRGRVALLQPLQGEALLTYLVLNVLNILDALLTWYVLRRGLAIEGNPVIGVIGLPGKIVLVAIAGCIVAHLMPRSLIVPIVALGLVALWTLTGVIITTA